MSISFSSEMQVVEISRWLVFGGEYTGFLPVIFWLKECLVCVDNFLF